MIVHPCPQRPWEVARASRASSQGLPDSSDLDDDPQLGSVALLKAAAQVTVSALLSQHGVVRSVDEEVSDTADCLAPMLARLIILRCQELTELLSAYRLAVQQPPSAGDDISNDPF